MGATKRVCGNDYDRNELLVLQYHHVLEWGSKLSVPCWHALVRWVVEQNEQDQEPVRGQDLAEFVMNWKP